MEKRGSSVKYVVDHLGSSEFNELLTANYTFISNYAFKLCRDEEASKDIAQDVCLRALKNYKKYNPGKGEFQAWIGTLTYNIFITYYRNRKRRHMPSIDDEDNGYEVPSTDDTLKIDTQIDTGEIMYGVKPENKQVLMLFYTGASYIEAAAELNIPLGTYKSRLFRAREQLRDKREQYYT